MTVTPGASTLVPQQTVQLTAVTRDAGGAVLSGRAVAWTSATPAAASVSAAGLVTAVAPGASVVTATSEGQAGTAAITVVDGGVILPTGNGFSAGAGAVAILAPAGAVTAGTPITVAPLVTPPAHANLIPGTAWTLGPDGTTFAQPVTVRITWGADQLPAGANAEQIRVHRHNGTAWVPLPAGEVNVGTRTASGTTTAFSPFALIEIPSNPLPVLASLSPTSVIAGSTGLTLTVSGSGFVASSEVRWNGSVRPTTFESESMLTAQVSAADIASPDAVQVTVVTPAPGGGESAASEFVVAVPIPAAPGIAAANNHTCGVTSAGTAYCWGSGAAHKLGNGSEADRALPTAVTGSHTFASVSGGGVQSCGVTVQGAALCWGLNFAGAVGDGSFTTRPAPALVAGGLTFREVHAGWNHSCGVTMEGTGYCWGRNNLGQIGDGTTVNRNVPTLISGGHVFTTIAVSLLNDFTCGIDQVGKGWCWGANGSGALGDGTTGPSEHKFQPVAVLGGHVFRAISTGHSFSCAIDTAGAAWCWGLNVSGSLGDGTQAQRLAPVPVQGGHAFVTVSSGQSHSCALTATGQAWCWGGGSGGRLGHDSIADSFTPVAVAGGHTFVSISVGTGQTCGVTGSGAGYCWGHGSNGKLGNGSNDDRWVPHPVSGGYQFR